MTKGGEHDIWIWILFLGMSLTNTCLRVIRVWHMMFNL